MKFYLGTDNPAWLWRPDMAGVPLFVSHGRMRTRRTPFPRATTTYAVDSGAYSELTMHGYWRDSPEAYVAALRRYWDEIGPFDFAAGQDYLCAPAVMAKVAEVTGRTPTVEEHQRLTVDNLLRLRAIAPDLPIIATLQGDSVFAYLAHVDMFADAGVDLTAEPVVGLGSIAAMPPPMIGRLVALLHDRGLWNLHGFGVKTRGVEQAGHLLATADSMAWSFAGRKEPLTDCDHDSCAHCPRWALIWRDRVLAAGDAPVQLGFAI